MIKKYHVTSDHFTGFIVYEFNDEILLSSFSLKEADLTEKSQIWFLKHQPRDLAELRDMIQAQPALKITEVPLIVSFDMFWNKYSDKDTSSKVRTARIWNKLTEVDQAASYMYIDKYFRNLPNGTRKKYAETYLNAQLWNN